MTSSSSDLPGVLGSEGHPWPTDCSGRLRVVPFTLKQANELVTELHRHHKKVHAHRFSIGVQVGDKQVGAAIVGRPVSRNVPQYEVVEAVRVVTDGTPNACSKLYGAVCRIKREMGFTYAITYILSSEDGTSLRAAGWKPIRNSKGGKWDRPSRRRDTEAPTDPKVCWACACYVQEEAAA